MASSGQSAASGDLPQDGVHEPPRPRRCEVDRGAHGGVGGDPGEDELVGAEAQQGAELGRRIVHDEAVDEEVARPPHAGRAVDELGDEAPVTGVERAAASSGGTRRLA